MHRNLGAEGCGYAGTDDPRSRAYVWSRKACQTFVQVHTEPAGWVGVVHSETSRAEFKAHAEESFPVRWADGRFPQPSDDCRTGGAAPELCSVDTNTVTQMSTCLCAANVQVAAVFADVDALPTAAEVVERLAIGSVPPSAYDAGTYTSCTSASCNAAAPDVVVHLHADASPPGSLDERTIFEVVVNGTSAFLLNKESIISLGNYSFRNPPRTEAWTSNPSLANPMRTPCDPPLLGTGLPSLLPALTCRVRGVPHPPLGRFCLVDRARHARRRVRDERASRSSLLPSERGALCRLSPHPAAGDV